VFRRLSAPTLRIARTDFQRFRDYLAKEGLVFEDRPYQEFLARRSGVTVNLYSNGKVVIGGNDQVLIGSLREFVMSLGGEEIAKETQVLEPLDIPFPHIGTDEVGKGDYFGPLIIARAVLWVEGPKERHNCGDYAERGSGKGSSSDETR
jgi:ribonuclease HIII